MTAPTYSSATVTSTESIGSSSVTVCGEAASFRASAPAVWNAMSLESTEWDFPPVSETRRSIMGKPAMQPFSSLGANTLLNARNELARDGPADHVVDELEAGPTLEGFDGHVAHGVLAVAPALLDVASVTARACDKGLAQGGPERHGLDVDAVSVAQPDEQDVHVCLAHRPENDLMGLGVVLEPHGGVLGHQSRQGAGQLVLVGLGDGTDCHR